METTTPKRLFKFQRVKLVAALMVVTAVLFSIPAMSWAQNSPPVAVANANMTSGFLPLTVQFDGSQSYDPEGGPLTYRWDFNDGTPFSTEESPIHTYQFAGPYTAVLTVFDSLGQSDVDSILITVTKPGVNTPPIADAGEDQTIFRGEAAVLSGSAMDADGDPILDWFWEIESAPAGSAPLLSGQFSPTPLLIPDLLGEYVVSLVVYDGTDESLPDTVTVTAIENLPPVAIATSDVTSGPVPLTVMFDGSQSYDPEGADFIILEWVFNDPFTPGGNFPSEEISPVHTFNFPGRYFVDLTVIDDAGQSGRDSIIITVKEPGVNTSPIANAGEDQTILLGDTIQLQGSATDVEGDPVVEWVWRIASQPPGSTPIFGPTNEPNPYFTPDMLGDYVLRLVAYDGMPYDYATVSDPVTIHVVENLPPIAVASSNVVSGPAPLSVNFDGSQSADPEGGALIYDWRFRFGEGPQSSSSVAPSYLYQNPGRYVATLIVVDDLSQFGQDTIYITVTEPGVNQPIDDLAARAKAGKVSLVWSPIPDAAGYNIFRSTAGGPYELIREGHESDYATYLDSSLTNGLTYCYFVRWMDSTGQESPDSNEACAMPSSRVRR